VEREGSLISRAEYEKYMTDIGSCAQPLPRIPPELERARKWLRLRSGRSGSNPPQLMVPFAVPLAGFSGRWRDRALLGLRVRA
jgi:hypothetical protein